MKKNPEGYNKVNRSFTALKDNIVAAKNHECYKDNSKAQRAFAIAMTNIEQANMWMNKGFYEEADE